LSPIQFREPVTEKFEPSLQKNLLRYPIVAAVLRSRWYPGILQAITAAFFGLILFQLLAGPTVPHDNLGTALTWVLWWPIIPIIFLFLGSFRK
jgi:hypothetical protein